MQRSRESVKSLTRCSLDFKNKLRESCVKIVRQRRLDVAARCRQFSPEAAAAIIQEEFKKTKTWENQRKQEEKLLKTPNSSNSHTSQENHSPIGISFLFEPSGNPFATPQRRRPSGSSETTPDNHSPFSSALIPADIPDWSMEELLAHEEYLDLMSAMLEAWQEEIPNKQQNMEIMMEQQTEEFGSQELEEYSAAACSMDDETSSALPCPICLVRILSVEPAASGRLIISCSCGLNIHSENCQNPGEIRQLLAESFERHGSICPVGRASFLSRAEAPGKPQRLCLKCQTCGLEGLVPL